MFTFTTVLQVMRACAAVPGSCADGMQPALGGNALAAAAQWCPGSRHAAEEGCRCFAEHCAELCYAVLCVTSCRLQL
jgi:hypothetical protein